ncbi:hypothetical protein ACIOZM_26400 [Pseudomonas sp. NPDC087346]|uniref:hypothetical protein n=1 Tax=Pseudomonas sp. NPDC087346 TaxID=3364438 RepID=UPI0038089724
MSNSVVSNVVDDSISQRMKSLLLGTGLNDSSIISAIFAGVDGADAVKNARGRPPAEIDVLRLIRAIDAVSVFIDGQNFTSSQRYRALLDGLWQIADSLTDTFGQSKVGQYKQTLLTASTPPVPVEPDAIDPATSAELSAVQTLQQLEALYNPILDPSVFIDDYIKAGIQRYEQESGTSTELLPNSYVSVTYRPGPYDPSLVPPNIRAPSAATVRVSLRDVVTGHYLYAFKQTRDTLGRQYSYPLTTFEPSGLISALTRDNLQTAMKRALSTYRENPANRAGLTAVYQNMLKYRSLAYLEGSNSDPVYRQAVQDFLGGTVQAKAVSFNGCKLNGVFLVPSGSMGGILFSVDDPGFFHVVNQTLTYLDIRGAVTEAVSVFPDTAAFKSWVLSKLPSATAQGYKNSPSSIFRTREVLDINAVPPGAWLVRPFSFTSSLNGIDLANKLFDGLMGRLDSDIDYIVFSSWEQTTGHLLEVAKAILMVGGIALNAAIPGTGALLARVGLFMVSLAVDAAYVAAIATQAQIADRPEDAAAFRNEAIIAGVLAGLGAFGSGAPSTSQEITEVRTHYRQTKSAAHTFIPAALRRVTWPKLANGIKVDLLVDAMKDSGPAQNLARLTDTDVVAQSIRQNLVLDSLGTPRTRFTWGDLALEQAQVQRRLQSDLARLTEVNAHIHRLLEAPPAVPRQTLQGAPERAAADWIVSRSRSAADTESVTELQGRIRSALSQNRQADLLDINTVDRLHRAVYQPAAGQVERVFRSSSDPLFMGLDIARAGFQKALDAIRIKAVAGQVDTGEALFAAIVRYHPYGDGNGRTARALYALAQLNKQESTFKALIPHAEDILSGMAPMQQ